MIPPDLAKHIHRVSFFHVNPDGSTTRHPAGRFMTAGGHLNILEDHHGILGDSLPPEGPMTVKHLKAIDRMRHSSYVEVADHDSIQQGKHPEMVIPQIPSTRPASNFAIHRPGATSPDLVEFRQGIPHLNGHPVDSRHVQALLHEAKNGHAMIRYHKDMGSAVAKMEEAFDNLFKAEGSADRALKTEQALAALEKLKAQGLIDPAHLDVLRKMAFTDEMTGDRLGNKFSHNAFLEKERQQPRGGVHVMADGNSFKTINDTYGHGAGDNAIRALADAFHGAANEVAPGKHKLWRAGGDEFAAHFDNPEHAAGFARAVRRRLEAVPPIQGQHKLSMSFGFGHTPDVADQALYEAKKQKLHPQTGEEMYSKHEMPSFAHSLVPGSEGPIPLASDQLRAAPPPAPAPEPISQQKPLQLQPVPKATPQASPKQTPGLPKTA